jgi:AcrR family transcriptional regulator
MQTRLKPRKRPSQERSSATVDAIITAATRILLAEGYAKTTTTKVAQVAGVSVGSLYQYFASREAIVAEIVVRRMVQISTAITEAHTDATDSLEQAVAVGIDALLVSKRESPALSLALREAMPYVEGRRIVTDALRALNAGLAEKLNPHLANRFGARPQAERVVRLAIAVAAVEGTLSETLFLRPDELMADDLQPRLVAVFLAALGAEP